MVYGRFLPTIPALSSGKQFTPGLVLYDHDTLVPLNWLQEPDQYLACEFCRSAARNLEMAHPGGQTSNSLLDMLTDWNAHLEYCFQSPRSAWPKSRRDCNSAIGE